tara:strand:+ start:3420 stop:3698 length:279 start_codon:yes stop_codon:yes gene_type:complete
VVSGAGQAGVKDKPQQVLQQLRRKDRGAARRIIVGRHLDKVDPDNREPAGDVVAFVDEIQMRVDLEYVKRRAALMGLKTWNNIGMVAAGGNG